MIDFQRMRRLINMLPQIQWDVERKMANAERITSNITGMPRGGNGNRQEDAYIILADVVDAYHETLEELEQMRAELKPYVDRLANPHERAVMRMRYMDGHRPEKIALAIDRDVRSVYRYLKRAEKQIAGGQNE